MTRNAKATAAHRTIAVPPGRDGKQEITAVFTAPDGSELPVRITMVQYGAELPGVFGVGVYPTERKGKFLRWEDGPEGEPVLIHWDLDGPPCGSR
jgi:hypothetical protein